MPKKSKQYVTTQYPDSQSGCVDFVANESVLTISDESAFYPDPAIPGVWRVTGLVDAMHINPDKHTMILYMAGYNDPWGMVREHNDFLVID